MKTTIVGGVFDDNGGRPSRYVSRLSDLIGKRLGELRVINGGTWNTIENFSNETSSPDVLLWFADIPNDKPKLLKSFRRKPETTLVISKNNRDGGHSYADLVGRILSAKAHLCVVFTNATDSKKILAEVIDPLGNSFISPTEDIPAVADTLVNRLLKLRTFTRKRSVSSQPMPNVIPDYPLFFASIRGYAEVLHKFVHADNQSRFLGNASFRCTKGGFPAIRDHHVVWISKRDLDKREISCDGFVPVDLSPSDVINYAGDRAPSVDAPIQVELFRRLPNVNFMLHTHAYIKEAPMTDSVVPCGAMEEVQEILNFCQLDTSKLRLNLRGHGSIAFGANESDFLEIPYEARPVPEAQYIN